MNAKLIKAVGIYEPLPIDHPNSFVDVSIPYPTISPYDLIVKVDAVSVNPADTRARLRKVNDQLITILGWDVVGRIVEVGSAVKTSFKVGDKVFYAGDIQRSGGNCEYHAIDFRIVGHKPKSITDSQAAALPLVSLTAWEALFEKFQFPIYTNQMDELLENENRLKSTLLIIGGAGGVGSMAIQLAKLVPNLIVIATASRKESTEWCLELGADYVIDHSKDLSEQLIQIGHGEVNNILICNSPDTYFNLLPKIAVPFGKICSIVPFDDKQDINILMKKGLTFYWELMFTRSSFTTLDMSKQSDILNSISTLVDDHKIISPVKKMIKPINAENIKLAHKLILSRRTVGKIVISGFD